jgi:hypothetical protein
VRLYLTACDPGADANQPVTTAAEIQQYLGRAEMLKERIAYTNKPALAECVAVTMYARHAAVDLQSVVGGYPPSILAEIDTLTSECAAQH